MSENSILQYLVDYEVRVPLQRAHGDTAKFVGAAGLSDVHAVISVTPMGAAVHSSLDVPCYEYGQASGVYHGTILGSDIEAHLTEGLEYYRRIMSGTRVIEIIPVYVKPHDGT